MAAKTAKNTACRRVNKKKYSTNPLKDVPTKNIHRGSTIQFTLVNKVVVTHSLQINIFQEIKRLKLVLEKKASIPPIQMG